MKRLLLAVLMALVPMACFCADRVEEYRRQKAVEIYESESKFPAASLFLKMVSFDRERTIAAAGIQEKSALMAEKYKEILGLIEESLYLEAMPRVLIEKKWAQYGVAKSQRFYFDSTFVADYERRFPNGESAISRLVDGH